jgi:hypothetical protein
LTNGIVCCFSCQRSLNVLQKKNLTRNDPSNISPKKMVMLKESQVQTALSENMVPPIPTNYHHHSPH